MSHTSLKLLIISSIFTTTSTYTSFGKEPDKIVIFQGQEKYLMHLIIACEYNSKHPFSVTPIIRKSNNKFHEQGEIQDLNEQDFKDIHHKNYVYLDHHTQKQTRLSGDQIVQVSLLILGTTDKESCLHLKFKQRSNHEIPRPRERYFVQMNTDQF